MHEETNVAAPVMTDAERYGIKISTSRVFKKQLPKPGHIFYIATFFNKASRIEEIFQVQYANITQYGEKAVKEAVITQVVAKYFTKAKTV